MKISFHIERLVLDGFDLSPFQQRQLQAGLDSELRALLSAEHFEGHFGTGFAVPSVRVAPIVGVFDGTPVKFGQEVARSIYSGIGSRNVASKALNSLQERKR